MYPTETLYGLGADATDSHAVNRVVRLKGRDGRKPILVLVSSLEMLANVVTEIPSRARRLIDAFWPGPLTLVFPARSDLPAALTGGRGTIGARHSSHSIAQALVEGLGRPLTSTSANLSGEPPVATIAEARRDFSEDIEIFIDGGTLAGGMGSTVVDVSGRKTVLVREGSIPAEAIEDAGVSLERAET